MVAMAFNAARVRPIGLVQRLPARRAQSFDNEREAHGFVRDFLASRGWEFLEQYQTGHGRIDFCLMADGEPWLGIEVKSNIDHRTNASTLADHLEQAMGYANDLGVPVLLGPAMFPFGWSMDSIHHGGAHLAAVPALVIFGGRSNVGVLAFDHEDPAARACMALRGRVFYRFHERRGESWSNDVEQVLRMVRSRNSQKVRA